jgi:ABC-type nitrate/sulfonate/bicarbonate transport system substrate-binding protein
VIERLRLLLLSLLLFGCALPALAAEATKMTIATGVDPGFSIFYVAKLGGFLEKNGIDVDLRTGPSGGAMVPLLISNASQASMSAAFAGISNHLKDPDIVAVAQMLRYDRWYGIVAKSDVKSLADLKTRKVGVSLGNASESYWYDALKHANLRPDDFKPAMVNVEAPEMVAAIERGDVQAFSAWEPWLSRTVLNVANTKVLVDDIGMVQDVGFIYMSRKWIDANRDTAVRFMKAMKESNDFINREPEKTKEMVGKMLNLPKPLLDSMWPKVQFTFALTPDSYAVTKRLVDTQVAQGKVKPGQFNYATWFYPDLLRTVDPAAVKLPATM